jgi:hypothetical protein
MGSAVARSDFYKQFLNELQKAGAELTLTGSGHWAIRKEGCPVVFAPRTPSDFRSIHKVKAKLRRAGILPRKVVS